MTTKPYKLSDWTQTADNTEDKTAKDIYKEIEFRKKDFDWYIGIDAGVSNGFFMCDKDLTPSTLQYKTIEFWDVIRELADLINSNVLVIIENPNLNKPVFHRFGTKGNMMQKIAQNVGHNKAYARLIIEYLQRKNICYLEVRPNTRKWTATEFRSITKITKRTSQHIRDAGKLTINYLGK